MREVSREEYQKLLESKIREIEHDFERYLTTVTLFHSIWDFFNRTRKFVVDIEPTLKLGDNRFVRPDIVFYDPREETILLIIEYKFGIKGSEEHLIEDLKNVEKYLQLVPDVILLFSDINSENERRKLWRIISKLDKRLIIWNALLDNEKQVIIFEKIKGEPKCKKFMNILKSKKTLVPIRSLEL